MKSELEILESNYKKAYRRFRSEERKNNNKILHGGRNMSYTKIQMLQSNIDFARGQMITALQAYNQCRMFNGLQPILLDWLNPNIQV